MTHGKKSLKGLKKVGAGHHVLQIVEATALAVLQVFVDRQAEEEETLE